jgi:hypothetical protein
MTFQDRSEFGIECPEQVFEDNSVAWRSHSVKGDCYAQRIRRGEYRLPSGPFLG